MGQNVGGHPTASREKIYGTLVLFSEGKTRLSMILDDDFAALRPAVPFCGTGARVGVLPYSRLTVILDRVFTPIQ